MSGARSDRRRLAIIGIGHVAEHQLEALATSPCWELVGAADLRAERRELLAPELPFFESAEELLREVQADMVLVSTPNRTHFELGKLVLEAGRNLLLEKPCCETPGQLEELVGTARRTGALFSVALHAAHARDLRWFVEHRASLALGELTAFHCGFFDPYIEDSVLSSAASSLGGSWFDSGINALSVIASLLPAARMLVADARFTRLKVEGCADPQATVELLHWADGASGRGFIETNWTLGINRKTTRLFFGRTNSEVLLDHSNEKVEVYRAGRLLRTVDRATRWPRLVNHYHGVFAEAFEHLRSGRSNLEFAVPIHRLLFAALGQSPSLAEDAWHSVA